VGILYALWLVFFGKTLFDFIWGGGSLLVALGAFGAARGLGTKSSGSTKPMSWQARLVMVLTYMVAILSGVLVGAMLVQLDFPLSQVLLISGTTMIIAVAVVKMVDWREKKTRRSRRPVKA